MPTPTTRGHFLRVCGRHGHSENLQGGAAATCAAAAAGDRPKSNPDYRRNGVIVRLPIQATSGSGTVTVPSAVW